MITGEQVIFFGVFVVVAYFGVFRSGLSLAPWVPTKRKDLERVSRLAALQPGERFVEAGCGDARVAIFIAKRNSDAMVVGVEWSILMFVVGWLRAKLLGPKNVKIKYGDVLKQDLGEFDVVYTYALTETVAEKMMPKVVAELKPGSRFISYAFAIQNEEGVMVDVDQASSPIYVYTK